MKNLIIITLMLIYSFTLLAQKKPVAQPAPMDDQVGVNFLQEKFKLTPEHAKTSWNFFKNYLQSHPDFPLDCQKGEIRNINGFGCTRIDDDLKDKNVGNAVMYGTHLSFSNTGIKIENYNKAGKPDGEFIQSEFNAANELEITEWAVWKNGIPPKKTVLKNGYLERDKDGNRQKEVQQMGECNVETVWKGNSFQKSFTAADGTVLANLKYDSDSEKLQKISSSYDPMENKVKMIQGQIDAINAEPERAFTDPQKPEDSLKNHFALGKCSVDLFTLHDGKNKHTGIRVWTHTAQDGSFKEEQLIKRHPKQDKVSVSSLLWDDKIKSKCIEDVMLKDCQEHNQGKGVNQNADSKTPFVPANFNDEIKSKTEKE